MLAPRLALPAVVALGALGCFRTERTSGERFAADLEPAALQPTPTRGPALGAARVRFYADDDYRAQNPDHQAKIRLLVERANQVLEPTIGVRLQVVEIRPWHRAGGEREAMKSAIAELESLDAAQDVELVIGMMDALSRSSTDLHQLGLAHVLGNHLVVRGLDDAAEVAALEAPLRVLSKKERQGLYSRRKRHKELCIFLHEVGHAFGGPHVTGQGDILNPRYHWRQADFGEPTAQLMRAVASARMARGPAAAVAWRKALDRVRRHPSELWNEDDKGLVAAELARRAAGGGREDEPGESLGPSVRAADRERFRAAERLLRAGQSLDAWEELEPLLDFYPDEPAVQRFACRLVVEAGRDRGEIESRCARAARAAPADPEPPLRLAQAYLVAGDKTRSLASARRALELAERGGSSDPAAPRRWGELAAHFRALGAVTWAEKAAGHAPDGKDVTAWARSTRVRFGMPAGGPIPPEREADYVAGVTELLGDVYASRFPEAERRAARLERAFGRSAGLSAARCDMEIRRGRYPIARTHCRDALRRDPDAAWAHYLLGLLDRRDRKPTSALDHLERAVALDPTLKHAYQVAAEIAAELGRPADRKRLSDAYQAQFGQPLP